MEIVTDPNEIDHTRERTQLEEVKGVTLGMEPSVVGRLHSKMAISYWKEVIKPAPVIVEWLEKKVPLFPKGVMRLASLPVLRPWQFTEEEKEWISRELERLRATGAIALAAEGDQRPECLLEVSPVFVVPKQGPKSFRLVIDLRRLNKTLPKKSFKFEGIGTLLRTIGRKW